MKKIYILLFVLTTNIMVAQEHAWVYFVDKPNAATYLANPLTMLSQRALDRRATQNLPLDESDVPISNTYINSIIAINGIQVKAKSKWLNAIHVIGTQADIFNLESLSYVDHVEFASNNIINRNNVLEDKPTKNTEVIYNYGGSLNQNEQIAVNTLHINDYTGQGIQIAVLDAGFGGVDTFAGFQRIRDNNQILGNYNFVERNNNMYTASSHGTSVLSTIAGYVDGALIGTAPDASFYLFITEDAVFETPLEESLWVEAAEKADSLGVNVINTSLGYQDFDDPKYDHPYSDFDGATAFITRGANFLAQKGIILTVSAGNDGNSFHYIAAPADANNVLTVGAVDNNGVIAGFSSYGPTFDGRIKPDVDAKGVATTIIDSGGFVSTGSGTSFASPVLCGAVACLWQAFPNKTSYELMQMIRESANLYSNPDDHYGYGIPNFANAYATAEIQDNINPDLFAVYPNPVNNTLHISSNTLIPKLNIKLINSYGSVILEKTFQNTINHSINIDNIQNGIYFLTINNQQYKIIKQQ